MSRRNSFFVVAVLLGLCIAILSTLPTATKHAMHLQGALHPWLHLLAFAVLSFLLLSTTASVVLRLLLLAALLLFGYATEAHESRRNGWPIEERDVRTDSTGTLLGAALSWLITTKHHQRPA